jgi:hypothetical protein
MKKIFVAAILLFAASALAVAQQPQFPIPPQMEKDLAARASDVSEVTLSKEMLGFAAKFMDKKDKDDAETQKLIQNLDGIYVRDYEFDKEGAVTPEEIAKLRSYFETSEWTPMVHERERKSGETSDILVKLVNGEPRGIFIFSAEPKELSIVLILGPIKMEDLGKLHGLAGLGALGDIGATGKSGKTTQGK